MILDVHSHLFFDALLGEAGDLGPRLIRDAHGSGTLVNGGYRWPIGTRQTLTADAGQRIGQLDAAGISRQVVSLSPLWLFHTAPAPVATAFARRANDLLAEWCGADRTRLAGMASLPAQDVGAAIVELERSVTELGLVGGYIGTDARPGLDDPDLDDLYSACVDLDVPLFVHSTMGRVGASVVDPRLDRWMGGVIYGYPIEETLAVSALVFGGVLERHPRLDVVVSHGGGTAAFLYGRMLEFAGLERAPIGTEEFVRSFGRLWFDTHVHSDDSLALLRAVANPERLVYGSNFGGWDSSDPGHLNELFAAELDANAQRLLRVTARIES